MRPPEFLLGVSPAYFFAAVGALPPITHELADQLLDAGPERALGLLGGLVHKQK